MTIINQFPEEISKKDLYKMTKGDTVSVRDGVGVTFKTAAYILYQDTNTRGENVEVLAVMTEDRTVYSTVSETFKTRFFDIVETFGDELPDTDILITEGTSKAGRQYASCTIA
jgi:hypothetical protein